MKQNRLIKKLIKIILIIHLLMNFSLSAQLINEDGHQIVSSIILGKSRQGHDEYIKALQKESIHIFMSSKYEFSQDIFFSNKNGEILLMPNFLESTPLFSDFTVGVFESMGGVGKLLKVNESDVFDFKLQTKKMNSLYLEGGATLSGEFANGEPYLIILNERYERSKKGAELMLHKKLSDEEFQEMIYNDYGVRAENLFKLPAEIGQEHLDLFLKAMPNGVLLIDQPGEKLKFINYLLDKSATLDKEDNIQYLNEIRDYEQSLHLINKRAAYLRKIQIVTDALKHRFTLIPVPGRFFSLVNDSIGRSLVYERTNFFNSFSGINQFDLKSYFFTNISSSKVLMNYWKTLLIDEFFFDEQRIYFVSHYSEGAGLDCIGAMVGLKKE